MSLDGNTFSFIPYSLNGIGDAGLGTSYVPYTGALQGTDLNSQAIQTTNVPALANDLTNKLYVDSAISASSILNVDNTFGYTNTNNLNGGIKTLQNATQFNPSLDANSYFITGVFPTTYVFTTNWTTNPVSGTQANLLLDPGAFYFDTTHKYVISFTGIFGTSASWVGTVFNNSTGLTVSDASIAITTSSQNLTMTFTAGSSSPTIYLRFVGASGTLRWTNFTIKEVDTQVMGNLIISNDIDSNVSLANGKTANLAGGLKVNQTSLATAPSLTTASLPLGVSASTLSGAYSLTATAGGITFGMWLGGSFTYTAGAKYTYTFTGFSTNATATQAMILYTNTYSGGTGTSIGDYIPIVPITSSTVSGSFTATSNNNVVWNFISSVSGRSISFTGFTLTRADTQITGVITAAGIATETPITTIGLNASNQLIKYTNPVSSVFTGSVGVSYIPYATSANVFANSLLYQSSGTQINCADSFYATNTITAGGDMNCMIMTASGGYYALDDRSLRPKDINPATEQFFFTSWNNDGGAPYADAIGMNGWTDSSGGLTNCLMVRKDTYGIRQYQGTFGSTTAFVNSPAGSAQYMDVCMKGVGNNTKTIFQPIGGTWNIPLTVGSGTDSGGCQIICTNGNCHIDSAAGNDIYIGYYRNPLSIFNYASNGIYDNVPYRHQYGDLNGQTYALFRNSSGGSSALFNLIIQNNIGNVVHFLNSSTRTGDGSERCYTIRNDTSGGVRFLSTNGGFSSYDNIGTGGATYTNAIVNYQNGAGTGNLGSWAGFGFTLFCNTTQPAATQAAYGIVSNNYNTNFVVSLSPGVRWMDIQVWAGVHYHYTYGTMAAYLVGGGWVNVSDAREKEDINDLKTSRSLERIMSCKPKYYKRKYYDTDKDGNNITPPPQSTKDEICIGLLAQDVLQTNPHCVSGWKNDNIKETDDDGTRYGINYGDFTVHLIGAVQEQQKQIETLSQRSVILETHARELEKQLAESIKALEDYKALTEERFNKLVALIQKK